MFFPEMRSRLLGGESAGDSSRPLVQFSVARKRVRKQTDGERTKYGRFMQMSSRRALIKRPSKCSLCKQVQNTSWRCKFLSIRYSWRWNDFHPNQLDWREEESNADTWVSYFAVNFECGSSRTPMAAECELTGLWLLLIVKRRSRTSTWRAGWAKRSHETFASRSSRTPDSVFKTQIPSAAALALTDARKRHKRMNKWNSRGGRNNKWIAAKEAQVKW